jgi:hypothetical protein
MKLYHSGLVVRLSNGKTFLVEKFGPWPPGRIHAEELRRISKVPGETFVNRSGELYWFDDVNPLNVPGKVTGKGFHGAIMKNLQPYHLLCSNCHDFIDGMCKELGVNLNYTPVVSVAADPVTEKATETKPRNRSSSDN